MGGGVGGGGEVESVTHLLSSTLERMTPGSGGREGVRRGGGCLSFWKPAFRGCGWGWGRR